MVMRNADVVSISDMTGIMEFGGIWKKRGQVYGAPAYWVLRSYAGTAPHSLLQVEDNSPTYSIAKGVTRLPDIPNTPYLDIIAAEPADHSKLLLFCVNRHLTRSLSAIISLSAFHLAGDAKATTITGDSIYAQNDEEQPERVAPVMRRLAVHGDLRYTFPNASVTVLEIPIKP